jgi:diaminohydroxyphosphoribosylaminopyrimidine deaminase/5-amino-6-(5-phosphoribosylamino)uracil reductase
MRRAAALAETSRPSPNPRVGSVVVADGKSVGEGWHRAPGEDHGEMAALRAAGERARGAAVYITLEPCNHFGRTPPCTDALIAAGVKRVVVGVPDPNPHVAGGGIERLRAAGIAVDVGVETDLCERLIHAWRTFVTRGTPFIVLKAAMSLDGRTATRTRESRWITSDASRADAHRLRAASDAILVGVGTVLADDPALTVRDVPVSQPPVRVVLDSTLRTPAESALVRTAKATPTWLFHDERCAMDRVDAYRARGCETFGVAATDGRVNLEATLDALARRGIVQVLVEGGGTVHGAFLDAGLGDSVVCYVAPMIFGGNDALPAFGGRGVAALADAPRIETVAVEQIGADLKLSGELKHVHRNHHGGR